MLRRETHRTWNAQGVGEVLHADYLFKEVLIDQLSRRMELTTTDKPTAIQFVNYIIWLGARYGFEKEFKVVTDRESHFTAEVVKMLIQYLRAEQNFSVAFAAWTNGSVESANV
eukprot:snap_masked-scaffold_88-processed-gene-0.26-mRNA-1 protein AED:0.65 eAED:0.65 QI:0/0/0/0.5/1/1/2/0/112